MNQTSTPVTDTYSQTGSVQRARRACRWKRPRSARSSVIDASTGTRAASGACVVHDVDDEERDRRGERREHARPVEADLAAADGAPAEEEEHGACGVEARVERGQGRGGAHRGCAALSARASRASRSTSARTVPW